MSFRDTLIQARESPATAYHLFLLQYPKSTNGIFAFFEGHDDSSFYTGFIQRYNSNSRPFHFYSCGNKKGVYDTFQKLSSRINDSTATLLFFVDKDYSDILGEEYIQSSRIFVTEYYSIENYLVSEQMLRKVWDDLFHFSNISVDYEIIQTKFTTELQNFYEIIRPITAWIIHVRKNNLKPILNSVNLSRVCVLNDDLAVESVGEFISELEQMCLVSTPESFGPQLMWICEELSKNNPKKYVRGKFELWFFIKFIEKLLEVIKVNVLKNGESLKTRATIGTSNAIQILGPRMQIPDRLEEFLICHLA